MSAATLHMHNINYQLDIKSSYYELLVTCIAKILYTTATESLVLTIVICHDSSLKMSQSLTSKDILYPSLEYPHAVWC